MKAILKSTAKDIGSAGWDPHSGAGIIRALAAYNKLFPLKKIPLKAVSDKYPKLKIIDDIVQSSVRVSPPWVLRNRTRRHGPAYTRAPFILATPHHANISYEVGRTDGGIYRETIEEYEVAIAQLEDEISQKSEELEYLQSEYYELQEQYNEADRESEP